MDESSNEASENRRLLDLTIEELYVLRSELDNGRASKLGKAYLKSIDRRISKIKKG